MKRYQNRLVVGVDAGNYNTKTQTTCFTSGYTELAGGHLSVKDLKRQTQDYYTKQADFIYNGRRYQIDISRVIVCPQGYADLLAPTLTDEMELLARVNALDGESRPIDLLVKEPLAILLDIGGGTVDPIWLEHGVPKPDFHASLSEGIITAYNEISAEIKAKSGRDVSESVISVPFPKN